MRKKEDFLLKVLQFNVQHLSSLFFIRKLLRVGRVIYDAFNKSQLKLNAPAGKGTHSNVFPFERKFNRNLLKATD